MAFEPIAGSSSEIQLGKLLQIIFSNGVRNQISEDFRDWEMVKRYKAGSSAARELRFMLQTSLGASAIQYRKPGQSARPFPVAQQVSVAEYQAEFKELNATIELEYNMWDRARKSPEKYAEPLALEIQSKTTASKRRLSADYYGDGSGAMGEVASSVSLGGSEYEIQLKTGNSNSGFVGFFEYGDLLYSRLETGAIGANSISEADQAVYQVVRKDRDADKVVVKYISGGTADVAPADDEVLYRYGQPSYADLSDLKDGTLDAGSATEVIAGLESLTADDGRKIHGITMSGALAGSRIDAGAQPLDVSYIQKALDNVKVAVGQDKYRWKMMCMAPEAHAALIESRETDRRFQTVEDNKRGIKYFAYVHGNDVVETYTSEYCPKNRIYIKPETKSSEKVMEYWGSDFETVKANGMSDFHLKPAASAAGGHENTIVSYLSAIGVLVCKHPASIAVVENFSL